MISSRGRAVEDVSHRSDRQQVNSTNPAWDCSDEPSHDSPAERLVSGAGVAPYLGATTTFVDVQSVPRDNARTTCVIGKNQESQYRLDGVLTRREVFVVG